MSPPRGPLSPRSPPSEHHGVTPAAPSSTPRRRSPQRAGGADAPGPGGLARATPARRLPRARRGDRRTIAPHTEADPVAILSQLLDRVSVPPLVVAHTFRSRRPAITPTSSSSSSVTPRRAARVLPGTTSRASSHARTPASPHASRPAYPVGRASSGRSATPSGPTPPAPAARIACSCWSQSSRAC